MGEDVLERLVLAAVKNRHLDRVAMKALLRANELLGLALGVRLAALRDSDDCTAQVFAESEASALYAKRMVERGDIVAERWARVPEKRRPHYKPLQRYRILRLKNLLALSRLEVAHLFRVAPSTIARWEQSTSPDSRSDLSTDTVVTSPPVRRYADVVRELVRSMALVGFGGPKTIAQTLARVGWKISERTVSRVLNEKANSSPAPPESSGGEDGAVFPLYPKHTILMDITEVPSLFGIFRFKIAAGSTGFRACRSP